MKTVKISALVLSMAGVFATTANAQSAKTNAWEGFFGQASVGFASFAPKIGTTTLAPTGALAAYTRPPISQTVAVATTADTLNGGYNAIGAGYNFGINQSYVLGLGVNYSLGASSAGSGSFTLSAPGLSGLPANRGGPLAVTSPISYQLKNIWSVALYPGYVIDKDKLAYAKVGYSGVTIGINSATAAYQTTNLSGYVLGLGYKQMVTQSIYVLGEANYAGFSNKATTLASTNGTFSSTVGGSGYDFIVGVGYRF